MKLIGRYTERKRLKRLVDSSKSEFLAIYGRRRIGKTFLIREYFNHEFDFYLTGLANANTSQQLVNFYHVYQEQGGNKLKAPPSNWLEAFKALKDLIVLNKSIKKKVIFIDELPWLDTPRSDLMLGLENFWNAWASARKDILLIVCGSAASWMINNLIGNTGGLYNRITDRISLQPFYLHEVKSFFEEKKILLNQYQILQLYMVLGGVPYYLNFVEQGKSATQNIDAICFQPSGILYQEYNQILSSLFRKPEKYAVVLEALSKKMHGLTRKELIEKTDLSSGGGTTKLLNTLEQSGFIKEYIPFGKKVKDAVYRLSDFYTLFFHRFMKAPNQIQPGEWLNMVDNPSVRVWSGFAFEEVCLYHLSQIKQALGIAAIQTSVSTWRNEYAKNGAQIDLVIDRRDQIINLCEMKFSINEYNVTKAYDLKIRNKRAQFIEETRTRKSVIFTMLTTYGLKKNGYHNSAIQNSLTMNSLFFPHNPH